MSYDHWLSTDRLGDEQAGEARAQAQGDEAAREARWADFVLACSRWGIQRVLRCATDMYCYEDRRAPYALEDIIGEFVRAENGWDAVFVAIARAIHESDATKVPKCR